MAHPWARAASTWVTSLSSQSWYRGQACRGGSGGCGSINVEDGDEVFLPDPCPGRQPRKVDWMEPQLSLVPPKDFKAGGFVG